MRLHFINQLQIMRYQFLSKRCSCCCCPTVGVAGRGSGPIGTVGWWVVASLPPKALLIECKYSFTCCCTHLLIHRRTRLLSLLSALSLTCCRLFCTHTLVFSLLSPVARLLHIIFEMSLALSLFLFLCLSVCCYWPKLKRRMCRVVLNDRFS